MKLNAVSAAVAHAAVGCAEGAASGGGCSGGAIGAAAGELVARQQLQQNSDSSNKALISAYANGEPTEQQKLDLISGLTTMQQNAVDMAKMAGALAALASGEDAKGINAAANAAAITATNNATGGIQAAIDSINKGTAKADLDKYLAESKNKTANQLADAYVASDNPLEQAAIFSTLVAQQMIQPGSSVEAVLMLASPGIGKGIGVVAGKVESAVAGRAIAAVETKTSTLLSNEVVKLSEANITNSGETVLGKYIVPDGEINYVAPAQAKGASYYEIDQATWKSLSAEQQWAANEHFLDVVAAKGDTIALSTAKADIPASTSLAKEIDYLTS